MPLCWLKEKALSFLHARAVSPQPSFFSHAKHRSRYSLKSFIIWASAWDFQQCGMCDQQSLRSACAYGQSDQSLCKSLEYSMIVKLLTEHHLEFLSLKGGCRGSSQSTHVKMPHCLKSHATAQIYYVLSTVNLLSSILRYMYFSWYPKCTLPVYSGIKNREAIAF